MEAFPLSVETAKRCYLWFHHSFPDYKNNEICQPEDIDLRNRLEEWLISQGE